jgi:hypothetical protein
VAVILFPPTGRAAPVVDNDDDDGRDTSLRGDCVVCLERDKRCVFDACGHLCVCNACAACIDDFRCPICRTVADRIIETY